jgi:hypothetical protein
MVKQLLFLAVVLLAAVAGGCAQNGPVQTVEAYLNARAEGDADRTRSLSCADWEAQAATQAMSFRAASNARVEGMTCAESGTDGDFTVVTCEGKVVTDYDGETREWPLGAYRVVQEDGEWRLCGEG